MDKFTHETVLLNEAVEGLAVKKNGIYVDATLGGGGHSEEIVKQLDGTGHLYAFDQDERAIAAAEKRLAPFKKNITIIRANFASIKEELNQLGIDKVDGVLFDLGVSSPQFDEADRGFSYRYDAPLDMRMDQRQHLTAWHIVNEWSFSDIQRVISRFGEEKFAKQIARKIEAAREIKPIDSTFELIDIIKDAIPAPARRKGGHPAKRTFQGIRMAVNGELDVMEKALIDSIAMLGKGGRLSVITFHSLEDRLCKRIIKEKSSYPELPRGLPVIPESAEPELKKITTKPIIPTEQEQDENRRSHSAKLRIAEKNQEVSNG
ncbi:16S rRNA (cytosine1402-N4)-methyltransferase [Sinobaca qinghaiensis]|uniref:Ribosomal RNA small subunit methyltransferase H n=1 Tax=Sinobaca qinghaiensis TaxID=342944 RepID=A0A419V642_9BACL|nr:16S rRNA (cytosine(1402)-N(4))-methyltransferase RsmH [Sinobaca qinghaiensis]RKD75455.1 16S rRNA (cytosine1402-N4)-methyltransferase [Sinobaca qinghaiensis]